MPPIDTRPQTGPGYRSPALRTQRRLIAAAAKKYGVPARILWGIYGAETNFGHNVSTSSAGAIGPWQFEPGTANGLNVNPLSFRSSTDGAARYLKQLRQGSANWHQAVGKYNAGPAGNLNNSETAAYIPNVFRYSHSWRGPTTGGGSKRGPVAGAAPAPAAPAGGGIDLAALLKSLSAGSSDTPALRTITPLATPSFSAQSLIPNPRLGDVTGNVPAPKPQSGPSITQILGALGQVTGSTAVSGARAGGSKATRAPRAATGGVPGVWGAQGRVISAPNSDRQGVTTQKHTLEFIRRIAGILGHSIVIGTGTNHDRLSKSGLVSDHWVGDAGDLKINGNMRLGDRIAYAAMLASGWSKAEAAANVRQGGGFNRVWTDGKGRKWRTQVIWRTGGHYDHVHTGIRRARAGDGTGRFTL